MATTKKIKLISSYEDIGDVLKELLGKDSENCCLYLDLPDTKDIYKTLSTNSKVIDWDIVGEINEPNINLEPDNLVLVKEVSFDNKSSHLYDNINSFDELASFIEAARELGRDKDGLEFGSDEFEKNIKSYYDAVSSSNRSINHVTMVMICQSYYKEYSVNTLSEIKREYIDDTIDKLSCIWKNIKDYTSLVSLAKALYGNK